VLLLIKFNPTTHKKYWLRILLDHIMTDLCREQQDIPKNKAK
jgi:hypothetical protein